MGKFLRCWCDSAGLPGCGQRAGYSLFFISP
jgi:hypothetical protein